MRDVRARRDDCASWRESSSLFHGHSAGQQTDPSVQRYGDFHIPTIPILRHFIYRTYGISVKLIKKNDASRLETLTDKRFWRTHRGKTGFILNAVANYSLFTFHIHL